MDHTAIQENISKSNINRPKVATAQMQTLEKCSSALFSWLRMNSCVTENYKLLCRESKNKISKKRGNKWTISFPNMITWPR